MNRAHYLTPSQQCYLAEILSLESKQGFARQTEIARRIGVNSSSVTAALRILAERALICYEPYEAVTLTSSGKQMAETILTRRRIIMEYLVTVLNIAQDAAVEAASQMQHTVPDIVINQLSKSLKISSKNNLFCP